MMKLTCRYNVLVGFPEAEKSHGCFFAKDSRSEEVSTSPFRKKMHATLEYDFSQMLHGTGIFTYIWPKFIVNVNKYSSPMEHLGLVVL